MNKLIQEIDFLIGEVIKLNLRGTVNRLYAIKNQIIKYKERELRGYLKCEIEQIKFILNGGLKV